MSACQRLKTFRANMSWHISRICAAILLIFLGSIVSQEVYLVTTVAGVAGSGPDFGGDGDSALFGKIYIPNGVWVNGSNVYIADTYNNRIRHVDGENNIWTIAGNGGQFSGGENLDALLSPAGRPYSVWGSSNGDIYFIEFDNSRVRKLNHLTGNVTTYAGTGNKRYGGDDVQATATAVNTPTHITGDTLGNMFISDYANHRIRMVNGTTNFITTFAGVGTTTTSSGGNGDDGPATSAAFNLPWSTWVDHNHSYVYVAEFGAHRIRRIDRSDDDTRHLIITIAGGSFVLGDFGGDGGPATLAALNCPAGIWGNSVSQLFIADAWNNRIRMVDLSTNIISTVVGTGENGYNGDGNGLLTMLNYPIGVDGDTNGVVYFTDSANNIVRKIALVPEPTATPTYTWAPSHTPTAMPTAEPTIHPTGPSQTPTVYPTTPPPTPPPASSSKSSSTSLTTDPTGSAAGIGIAVAIVVVIIFIIYRCRKNRKKYAQVMQEQMDIEEE